MTLEEIYAKVSEELGIPKKEIAKIYGSYWRAIKEYIATMPLKDDLSDDVFSMLKPNINIPSLGKMHVTLDRYRRVKRVNEQIKERTRNAAHKKD